MDTIALSIAGPTHSQYVPHPIPKIEAPIIRYLST